MTCLSGDLIERMRQGDAAAWCEWYARLMAALKTPVIGPLTRHQMYAVKNYLFWIKRL